MGILGLERQEAFKEKEVLQKEEEEVLVWMTSRKITDGCISLLRSCFGFVSRSAH